MKFLIVIPVHNEENFITYTLKSLEQQSFKDFKIVVVNDGSTDNTGSLIEDFKTKFSIGNKITTLHLDYSVHQPGAKVVHTFNKGLESTDLKNCDVICKFDADIIFPVNYLEELNILFSSNPRIGMASGIVKICKKPFDPNTAFDFSNSNDWEFENISSKNHVRGPIKAYRKECFLDMKGLRPTLGWDNIDVLLARMKGWDLVTNKHLWVKHLRPTAFKYRNQKAEKLGEYFYNIGLSFPLMIISALKSSIKNRSIGEFLVTISHFLKQKHALTLTKNEIQFIRNYRWKQILKR